jgi:serine protease
MASPHVAGVAALYRALNPGATATDVHTAVVNNASINKLSNVGTGSPNRLLYSLFGGGVPGDPAPVARFTFSCTGLTCAFDGSSSTDDPPGGITRHAWNFGDGGTATGSMVNHTYSGSGTFNVTLTVTDTANQTDSESHSVTVSGGGGGDPCTNCERYTGALSGTGDSDYHPNGTYYYSSTSGTHRGWLRGPAGTDFDLYLYKWNGFFWSIVARSESATSEEQIVYNGTPGYYRWRVYSYSGGGTYTFWLQRP